MRTVEDNCVGCDWCADCGRKHQEVIYCDKCGDQVWECDVMTEDGEDYCLDCWEQKQKEDLIERNKDKLTLEYAEKIGENETRTIELNGFLVDYLGGTENIIRILEREAAKDEFDETYFLEWLEYENYLDELDKVVID